MYKMYVYVCMYDDYFSVHAETSVTNNRTLSEDYFDQPSHSAPIFQSVPCNHIPKCKC